MTPAETTPASSIAASPSRARRLLRCPFSLMLLGSLLLWLAQPGTGRLLGLGLLPLGLLGWVAMAPWVGLALRRAPLTRGGYAQVWLGGWAYWLLTLYWVCFPHPLTPIGWPLLAGYLALYPLAFIGLTRRVLRRTTAPVAVAAPLVWVSLEFAQMHLFTGFGVGALSHTQADLPLVMQVSDATGAYGVSFVLMMSGACAALLPSRSATATRRVAAAATTIVTAAAVLFYGHVRLQEAQADRPGPRVALIQGATWAVWDADPDRNQRIMDAQSALTRRAAERAAIDKLPIDLYVWPESMFRAPLVTMGNKPTAAAELPEVLRRAGGASESWLAGLSREHGAAFLVGADRFDLARSDAAESGYDETFYNTAAFATPTGGVAAFYDKTHRVPFGEYIPFAKNMPALYYLTPMSGGLGEGAGPVSMPLQTPAGTVRLAPSICYETVIPHVIRRHVAQLADRGEAPDLLVNLTNDAWFWGATELDLHLACSQYRAVENRTPMIIAANTGLSAVIDGSGRVLRKSQRMTEDVIVATAPLDPRSSLYSRHGDWFALGCLTVTVVVLLMSLAKAERGEREADNA